MAILPELETARLSLRRFVFDDAPFVVELLNQPSFIRNIGDRGVRTVDDARRYLHDGPMAMYEKYGFGLWRASRRTDDVFVGMCGLLKRDILPDVDVGYAFLPEHWGQGYAFEAADATVALGARKSASNASSAWSPTTTRRRSAFSRKWACGSSACMRCARTNPRCACTRATSSLRRSSGASPGRR